MPRFLGLLQSSAIEAVKWMYQIKMPMHPFTGRIGVMFGQIVKTVL
jgi:hypothetical protein